MKSQIKNAREDGRGWERMGEEGRGGERRVEGGGRIETAD